MTHIRNVVVPLYETRGPDWKGLGSASIIASFGQTAIFLTARHVLEAVVNEVDKQRRVYPRISSLVAIIDAAENSFIAEVYQLSISEFSDIGFGVLIAPGEKQFGPCLAIDPSPVIPGTKVRALGYSGFPIWHKQDWDAQRFGVTLHFYLQSREGAAIDRHLGGVRHLKWPVFHVDTNFDSGMSGGPVIEIRGTEPIVRGVICCDMSIGSDLSIGGGGQALASELWPILMMPFPFNLDFFAEDETPLKINTLFDLIRERFLIDRGNTTRDYIWEPNGDTVKAGWRGVPGDIVAPIKNPSDEM